MMFLYIQYCLFLFCKKGFKYPSFLAKVTIILQYYGTFSIVRCLSIYEFNLWG